MVNSLESVLFDKNETKCMKCHRNRSKMEDDNNNVEILSSQIERSERHVNSPGYGTGPQVGTSQYNTGPQPLDNVDLVFTSNGGNFSITLHEVIGRLVIIDSILHRCIHCYIVLKSFTDFLIDF